MINIVELIPNDNLFHHVCVTNDSIYIDGTLAKSNIELNDFKIWVKFA